MSIDDVLPEDVVDAREAEFKAGYVQGYEQCLKDILAGIAPVEQNTIQLREWLASKTHINDAPPSVGKKKK